MKPYRALTSFAGAALDGLAPLMGDVWRERLALRLPRLPQEAVWFHGASVGEISSARFLMQAMAAKHPVFVTTNSITGRALAQQWGYSASLAPVDLPNALDRFIAGTRPKLYIAIEAELWPNRSALLQQHLIPQAMIGARLSPRSAKRWAKMPRLIQPVLGRFDLVTARDQASETRFLQLGLPQDILLPPMNLKLIGPTRLLAGNPAADREKCILIASSHEDEEAALLQGVEYLRRHHPELRIIWAPRHPERFDPLAKALPEFARRSRGAGTDVNYLLADTIGEMDLWYPAAGAVLICGSFGAAGGHSPWEAAGHGSAILHGPEIASAAEDYAALDQAGAAISTTKDRWHDLAAAVAEDPIRQRDMQQKARQLLTSLAGDAGMLVEKLSRLAEQPRNTDIKEVIGGVP